MTLATLQPLLDWIQNHPGLAGLLVFAVAAAESLAVIGILVPGIVFMVGVGALIGLGVLELWSTVVWAAAGAIVGDGVSYWLGRHFDKQLRSIWPFTRHPELIPRGERFFHKHGGKSVLFGRFIGPMRPVIPAIAGIMHMNPYHFYFVNILSAITWAPVVLLPGVVFGSSFHLATAVSVRLVVVILIIVAMAWLFIVGLRTVITPLLLKIFGRWESHWDFVVRNAFNSAVVLLVLLLTGAGYYAYISAKPPLYRVQSIADQALWWQSAWQSLPVYRDDSEREDPLTVQWWGELGNIKSSLQQQNWQPANTLTIQNAIMWLSPSPEINSLPVLSKDFHGTKEALLWVKMLDDHQQLILRMWPAFRPKVEPQPHVWVATVSIMELKQPYPTFFYPHIDSVFSRVANQLLAQLPANVYTKQVTRSVNHEKWDGSILLIKQR
ncbi:MAG: VTT domain-containing protein [Gammaproteobacteria bacterium]|jgi:membrane protein DedA with SNARE-associated domain